MVLLATILALRRPQAGGVPMKEERGINAGLSQPADIAPRYALGVARQDHWSECAGVGGGTLHNPRATSVSTCVAPNNSAYSSDLLQLNQSR